MATFSEIVYTAVEAATHRVAEGSRRNARRALEVRHQVNLEGSEALAGLAAGDAAASAANGSVPAPRQHRAG